MPHLKNYIIQFKKKSLEECVNEIDSITKQLESNNLSLEETIILYKNGKIISNIAKKKLSAIEFEFSKLNEDISKK